MLATLVVGATATAREAAIAAALDTSIDTALILEGLPDGSSRLDALSALSAIHIVRIAPGCLCCTGNLTMRVSLNRILRRHPTRLYIGVATFEHLDRIRGFLTQTPYDGLLQLTQDLHAYSRVPMPSIPRRQQRVSRSA
ncbi:MAG: GTPase [Noviherbaspirillum sp.]